MCLWPGLQGLAHVEDGRAVSTFLAATAMVTRPTGMCVTAQDIEERSS